MAKVSNTDIYNYDNFLDARDFLLGTDWNNARKTKSFKLEHLRHFILQGLDPSNNGFITTTGYTLVDNILTVNAGWVWQLNGMLFTNEEEVVFTLEYTAEGFVRIDSIYANSNNELLLTSGGESETIAVPPQIPINTILAFSVNIFDTSVLLEEEPVLGNIYLKKIFDKTHDFTASGTDVVIPFHLYGYSTIELSGALTSISGFSSNDLVANPAVAEYPHDGKLILLVNRSGHNITLKNADFASLAVAFFAFDGGNIVIPNNGKLFIKYTADGLIDILKSWTTTDDVIGLPEELDLKADLVGGKVPTEQLPSYVDDVLEYANLAAFPITGEASKIYIALDTNFTYRWTGSVYVKISDTGKLDKVSTVDVEKVYIKNADGTQSMKPISELLSEKLVTNATVTGTYNVDWTNDVWDLTLTGNTTLSESNLPATGKTKTITLNISGNHTLTYPSGWTSKITGAYSGTATLNTITIQYFGAGKYKVLIVQPT